MSKAKRPFNHSTDKEKAMESKIVLLEQRLRLVEQFVELRFCESFKDFTIRKMLRDLPSEHPADQSESSSSSEDENSYVPSKSSKPPPSSSTQQSATRTSTRTPSSAPSTSKDTGNPTNKRELRVRVLRTSGTNQNSTTSTSPPKSPPNPPPIKNPPPGDSDDDFEAPNDNDPDDNFTDFNPEDVEVTQDNSVDSDPNYSEATSPSPPKKRGRPSSGPMSSKKKSTPGTTKRIPRGNKKECPECHTFWKPEAFDKHLGTHSKERNLQCRFCDKKFIQRKHLAEHEKGHNLAKYGKMCRVEGCGQLSIDKSKLLVHERRCIRKKLEGGGMVDEEVLEDVRRRSQNVELGWPEEDKGEEVEGEGTEVDGVENNLEGIVEGVVEMMEEETAQLVDNLPLEGDPLGGGFA